jgi:acyl-CoA thioesterase YciA
MGGGIVTGGRAAKQPAQCYNPIQPISELPMSELASPFMNPSQVPTERELVLRMIPMPADANANGDIFGGWIMAQVDLAGSVLPQRISRGRIATVAVKEFIFKQAVSVGDLLSFYASVVRVGRTSITVQVEVYAERDPSHPQVVKVTEAQLTFVAIDDLGKPREFKLGGN